ncbi:MAG: hypothetical protein ACO22T_06620 [Burkholderiales bacterium]|jgi:hypothetical protein
MTITPSTNDCAEDAVLHASPGEKQNQRLAQETDTPQQPAMAAPQAAAGHQYIPRIYRSNLL